jgi:Tat protein secretion system quality control protein TatD with DNase activity
LRETPNDRFLLETDAAGLGQEGHPEESPDLLQIANDVAHLRGMDLAQLENPE